jgi:hypothetical protein
VRLWRLRIERFRGIRELVWALDGRVSCLIGSGDMAKTTVLDAIGLLGTSWAGSFDDYDFFAAALDNGPIVIEGTFGDLPRPLIAENRLGLDLVGIDAHGEVHDEPGLLDPGVVIRLEIDDSLEPTWRVMSARNPEGRVLTGRDRASLGITRLGAASDRQFSLGKGTALSRATAQAEDIPAVLVRAYREARQAVGQVDLASLDQVVQVAAAAAVDIGAGSVANDLHIGLEVSPTSASGLMLQQGGIPVRTAGLGTKRLLALGLELGSASTSGVLCVDELEYGLEPHRIRHLVTKLRSLVEPGDDGGGAHVIFTSHSPVVLAELGCEGLNVVRNDAGKVSIKPAPADLVAVVRAAPEALLAPRVLVGEGKTEVGIVRAFSRLWQARHGGSSLAQQGVALVEGGGHTAAGRAADLTSLGYPVLLLADSDVPLSPSVKDLAAAGVTVVQWEGECCTEERVLTDLSWDGVREAFGFVVRDGREPSSVVQSILDSEPCRTRRTNGSIDLAVVREDLDSLVEAGFGELEVRRAFAAAASRSANGWFKRIDTGQSLGEIAAGDESIAPTPFGSALARVEAWCHD